MRRDVVAGVMFAGIGFFALIVALNYSFGSTLNMGAGYFPVIVSSLILIFAIVLVIREFRVGDATLLKDIAWRPLVIITIAVVGFGLLIDRFGLVPAVSFLVIVGWYADPYRSRRALPAQLGLGILLPILIFRVGLNMPFELWGF